MLPGEQALKWEVVVSVTPTPLQNHSVPLHCSNTHTHKEWWHHGQRAQKEAAPWSAHLVTFRDDLYGARPSQSGTCVLVLLLGLRSRN